MTAGARRPPRELSLATAAGLDPGCHCTRCRRRFELEADEHVELGPGERGYTCPACGETVVFYSSRWLDDRKG